MSTTTNKTENDNKKDDASSIGIEKFSSELILRELKRRIEEPATGSRVEELEKEIASLKLENKELKEKQEHLIKRLYKELDDFGI